MKKVFFLFILLFIGTSCLLFFNSLFADDLGDFYPGRLVFCFSATGIRSNVGEVEITKENGIVQTQFAWFNEIATEYQIIEMRQLFQVKDTEWNQDGVYLMNIFKLEIADHSRTEDLRVAMETMPDILFVEKDPVLRSFNDHPNYAAGYTPNDPLMLSQYALNLIEAEKAWFFEKGSRDIIVGIVDSGTKWNHPDLRANIWTNLEEYPGITLNWDTGQIIGGNGTENVIGWDFAHGSNWWDIEERNNPYQDFPGNQHGTHVAGCAAAVGDNGIGVVGPAFNVRIMNTKHSFTYSSTNSIINGYEGIMFCVNNGANIINTSWGGAGDGDYANYVISYAKAQGVLVVSSAGNRNDEVVFYPAGATDAFAVAATDRDDLKASFSSYGSFVDISAPGVGILSTYYDDQREDNYATASGTSMSGPVMAGVAALVWSYYPELTVDELKERLRRGADPIDHLNQPQYHGKLGAGRANAFNSLMYDKLPRVDFHSFEQIEVSGEDNTLNPGETLTFKIHLKNRDNWLDGLPTTASIHTDNPWVELINPTVNYGIIPQGQVRTSENSFIINVNENTPVEINIEFILTYFAKGESGYNYDYEIPFTVLVSRNKDNWPLDTGSANVSSVIVFDLNLDGENEIIFLDNRNVHVMNSLKEYHDGFPLAINMTSSNPLMIVKSGNEYEIVVTGQNKLIKINKAGIITAETTIDGAMMSSAVAYDIDNDGIEEIAVGTTRGLLYLFNNDLSIKTGYPIDVGSVIVSMPLFIDYNNDGNIDIIVNTIARNINIFTAITGEKHSNSPIQTGVNVVSGLVAATNGNDVFVYSTGISHDSDNVKVIDKNGLILASTRINGTISTLPIIADLDNSGNLDFVIVTNSGVLYLYDGILNIRPGFPISLGGIVSQHPILADIDNDGVLDIIVLANNGTLHAIKMDGSSVAGFPFTFFDSWRASPVFTDVDGSGRINFMMSNIRSLYYLDLPARYSTSQYPMHAYSRARNAVYSASFVNDGEIVLPDREHTRLLGNIPNPFNPETKISFIIKEQNVTNAHIDIFNIRGQRVQTLSLSETNIKNGYVIWTSENLSSGLYFYRLIIDNQAIDVRRAILMK